MSFVWVRFGDINSPAFPVNTNVTVRTFLSTLRAHVLREAVEWAKGADGSLCAEVEETTSRLERVVGMLEAEREEEEVGEEGGEGGEEGGGGGRSGEEEEERADLQSQLDSLRRRQLSLYAGLAPFRRLRRDAAAWEHAAGQGVKLNVPLGTAGSDISSCPDETRRLTLGAAAVKFTEAIGRHNMGYLGLDLVKEEDGRRWTEEEGGGGWWKKRVGGEEGGEEGEEKKEAVVLSGVEGLELWKKDGEEEVGGFLEEGGRYVVCVVPWNPIPPELRRRRKRLQKLGVVVGEGEVEEDGKDGGGEDGEGEGKDVEEWEVDEALDGVEWEGDREALREHQDWDVPPIGSSIFDAQLKRSTRSSHSRTRGDMASTSSAATSPSSPLGAPPLVPPLPTIPEPTLKHSTTIPLSVLLHPKAFPSLSAIPTAQQRREAKEKEEVKSEPEEEKKGKKGKK